MAEADRSRGQGTAARAVAGAALVITTGRAGRSQGRTRRRACHRGATNAKAPSVRHAEAARSPQEDRVDLSRDEPPALWPAEADDRTPTRARTPATGRAFVIRTDGAARGNPGPASLGAVLLDASRPDARDPRAVPDATISEYLGVQTNNVAEYTGVVRALALAAELGAREVHLLLDSKLIVEQLAGRWRVKDAKLIPLNAEARGSLARFARWTAAHVPRAQNALADALANEAIDRVAAGGPPLVVVRG